VIERGVGHYEGEPYGWGRIIAQGQSQKTKPFICSHCEELALNGRDRNEMSFPARRGLCGCACGLRSTKPKPCRTQSSGGQNSVPGMALLAGPQLLALSAALPTASRRYGRLGSLRYEFGADTRGPAEYVGAFAKRTTWPHQQLTATPKLAAVTYSAGFGPQTKAPQPPNGANARRTARARRALHWCCLGGAPVLLRKHSLVHRTTH